MTQWFPQAVRADADYLLRMPTVLRALVRYAHEQRGIPAHLTGQTLDAVDDWDPVYADLVRGEGPLGRLGQLGQFDPDDPSGVLQELLAEWGLIGRSRAEEAVGGPEALADVDDTPLPDEPFSWDGIPDDIRPRVETVLGLCHACAAELFDTEMRTAFRRVLSTTAAADPAVFRRTSRDNTAAAAIAWAVVGANNGFTAYGGGMTAASLLEYFDVTGSVSDRARPFLRAFGVSEYQNAADLTLGTPEVLTGPRRTELMRIRDMEA